MEWKAFFLFFVGFFWFGFRRVFVFGRSWGMGTLEAFFLLCVRVSYEWRGVGLGLERWNWRWL